MTAFLYQTNNGLPGGLSRGAGQATITPEVLDSASPFAAYGLPGKIVSGQFVPVSLVGDTAPAGILVRPYPTTSPNASDPLGTSTPPTTGVVSVLRRGYIMVKCNAGVPAEGGAVYIRYAAGTINTPIGGIEAAAVAGDTVALTNCVFNGPADANGNVEIAFNI